MYIEKLQVFHGETKHKSPCIVMHLAQPKVERPEKPEEKPEMVERDESGGRVRTHTVRARL